MNINKYWTLRNTAAKKAELTLYGPISSTVFWGDEVTPKQLAKDLNALGDIDDLTVRINSVGGNVFAGIAIYNILKSHKATVTVKVDGLAASIASVIAMAGDTIVMPTGSMMMIHNPTGNPGFVGATEMRKMADLLDQVRESLIDVYAERTGLTRAKIGQMMDAETWLSAAEALKEGFASEVTEEQVAASISNNIGNFNGQQFDLSNFKRVPAAAGGSQSTAPARSIPNVVESDDESIDLIAAAANRNREIHSTSETQMKKSVPAAYANYTPTAQENELSDLIAAAMNNGRTAEAMPSKKSLSDDIAAAINLHRIP